VHKPLQEVVGDSLQDLKRRGIVRVEFIDALLNELVHSPSDDYETMAWVLMMLEQWFRQHRIAA
jgi:asparagine synthase (glutamine-hydrolysing)